LFARLSHSRYAKQLRGGDKSREGAVVTHTATEARTSGSARHAPAVGDALLGYAVEVVEGQVQLAKPWHTRQPHEITFVAQAVPLQHEDLQTTERALCT
jgi:hypothetical protein